MRLSTRTSTDTSNRTFGTRRSVVIVVLVFLLSFVARALVPSRYAGISCVPDQINEKIMVAATNQSNAESIANENAPNGMSLVDLGNSTTDRDEAGTSSENIGGNATDLSKERPKKVVFVPFPTQVHWCRRPRCSLYMVHTSYHQRKGKLAWHVH
jgi:hypothetical protein